LVLVGSSDYLDGLRAATTNPRVHFVGFAPNPIDWVRLFDVGLLPSYFASESLPNCVAEYLFCGAPVVATRIGEIPQPHRPSDPHGRYADLPHRPRQAGRASRVGPAVLR
jgi:hypothetical protein